MWYETAINLNYSFIELMMSGFGDIERELSKLTSKDYDTTIFTPRGEAVIFRAELLKIEFQYNDGIDFGSPELLLITDLGVVPLRRFGKLDKVTEALWETFNCVREPECHDWLSNGTIDRPIRERFGRHGVRYVVDLESDYQNRKAALTCSVTQTAVTSLGGNPGFMLPKRKDLHEADTGLGTLKTLAYKLKGTLSSYVTD